MVDPLGTFKIASPHPVPPRAAHRRGMFAFGSTLFVMFVVELAVQAFGLRALSAVLSGRSMTATSQNEIDRTPIARCRPPRYR